MLEFCYFYSICCVVSENHIFLSVFKVISVLQSNGKNISNCCCCCWEYFPPRGSKKLIEVGEKLQSLVRIYIFHGYTTTNPCFPDKICGNCKINIYLVASGENNRGPWGEKISKVNPF